MRSPLCGRRLRGVIYSGPSRCGLRWLILDAISRLIKHALEALTESLLKQVVSLGLRLLLHLLLRLLHELQGLGGRGDILVRQVLVQMLLQDCVELVRLEFC